MVGEIHMKDIIDKESLFGDEYKAFILCEYTRELNLIKQLIHIAEEGIEGKKIENTWSFEGVCYAFAKTIVDYSKMAYDNLLLGHFHSTNMINRAILENCVLLDVIVNYDEYELWKYYLAHSYRSTIYKSNTTPKQIEINSLNDYYIRLNISEDFYKKQAGEKNAYICRPYGWTYKINKTFSFAGVCKLVGDAEYHGFQLMSDYSHGTSFYTKLGSSIFVEQMMSMFVSLYIELYRMVTLFCLDTVDDSFDEIAEKLENIFYRFIEHEEEVYGEDE